VISATEESRLGREAVLAAMGPEAPLRCIVDLGGGSLEISILREHAIEQAAQLPVGTVRLMTMLDLRGVIHPAETEQVRRYVRALLESKLTPRPNLGRAWQWRSAETRKRWRVLLRGRGSMACRLWSCRSCANACRISLGGMCASA